LGCAPLFQSSLKQRPKLRDELGIRSLGLPAVFVVSLALEKRSIRFRVEPDDNPDRRLKLFGTGRYPHSLQITADTALDRREFTVSPKPVSRHVPSKQRFSVLGPLLFERTATKLAQAFRAARLVPSLQCGVERKNVPY